MAGRRGRDVVCDREWVPLRHWPDDGVAGQNGQGHGLHDLEHEEDGGAAAALGAGTVRVSVARLCLPGGRGRGRRGDTPGVSPGFSEAVRAWDPPSVRPPPPVLPPYVQKFPPGVSPGSPGVQPERRVGVLPPPLGAGAMDTTVTGVH